MFCCGTVVLIFLKSIHQKESYRVVLNGYDVFGRYLKEKNLMYTWYLRSSVVETVKNLARTPFPFDVYAKIVMSYSVYLLKFFSSVAVDSADTFFVLSSSWLPDFLYNIR